MNLQKSDKVAIVGTGMIAFAAAQWAVKYGAKEVTVIGRSEEKRKVADSLQGVSYGVIGSVEDEFDSVLEAVGSGDAIDASINLVKAGGILVLMGNPSGDIMLSQDTYWRVLRKQLILVGTWNSSYENGVVCDWSDVRDALTDHSIEASLLVSHQFAQEKLVDALRLMYEHKESYCKVMTIWNQEE